MKATRVFSALALTTLLTGCQFTVDSPNVQLDPKDIPPISVDWNLEGDVLSCSALLAPEAGGTVESGQAAPIKVLAKGGVAPYQILNSAITFNDETVLSRTYTNNGTANKIEVDTVVVKDKVGLISQCNFMVTVEPAGNPQPSDLACSLALTPSSPGVNQDVFFTATASGGNAPYLFSGFQPGSGGSIVAALGPVSSTEAAATAKYSTIGLRTASVKLTDDDGEEVVCSKTVDVVAAPTLNLVASPANSVSAGSTLTVTASAAGFSGTPTFSFATTQSGVSITSVGNVAQVTSATIQPVFQISVTASTATQFATKTINLAFSAPSSMACSVTHTSGMLYVNNPVQFTVTAANGHPLEITYFDTHSDGTVTAQSNASRTVKYSVPGVKLALFQAKSLTNGALCQAGATLSDTLEITAQPTATLGCTAFTSTNPSYEYDWFTTWATITGGVGTKWVQSITVKKNGNATSSYEGTWESLTSARIRFFTWGNYQLELKVKDSAGSTGTCSINHEVRPWF